MAEDFKRAGWYPDPTGAPGERWWNGATWSETKRGAAAPTASSPIIYSASNPAPERPDPYAAVPPLAAAGANRVIDLRLNRYASIGFLTGLISLFFNAFFVLAPIAIVFSILGLRTAARLKAQGIPNTGGSIAWVGLACGVIGVLISIVTLILFIASITFDVNP